MNDALCLYLSIFLGFLSMEHSGKEGLVNDDEMKSFSFLSFFLFEIAIKEIKIYLFIVCSFLNIRRKTKMGRLDIPLLSPPLAFARAVRQGQPLEALPIRLLH